MGVAPISRGGAAWLGKREPSRAGGVDASKRMDGWRPELWNVDARLTCASLLHMEVPRATASVYDPSAWEGTTSRIFSPRRSTKPRQSLSA